MKHSLLVMVIPGVAWAWSYYRQENFGAKDHLQEILSWVFMGGIGLFMLTILYKALVSRPKCPTCQRKMREVETITISEKQLIIKSISLENDSFPSSIAKNQALRQLFICVRL
ncbi:hypothetical protein N9Z94_00245 [Akkermansiaceae bacterium]|nr:hypothetical protein [Akkermansiaceae bacterium]